MHGERPVATRIRPVATSASTSSIPARAGGHQAERRPAVAEPRARGSRPWGEAIVDRTWPVADVDQVDREVRPRPGQRYQGEAIGPPVGREGPREPASAGRRAVQVATPPAARHVPEDRSPRVGWTRVARIDPSGENATGIVATPGPEDRPGRATPSTNRRARSVPQPASSDRQDEQDEPPSGRPIARHLRRIGPTLARVVGRVRHHGGPPRVIEARSPDPVQAIRAGARAGNDGCRRPRAIWCRSACSGKLGSGSAALPSSRRDRSARGGECLGQATPEPLATALRLVPARPAQADRREPRRAAADALPARVRPRLGRAAGEPGGRGDRPGVLRRAPPRRDRGRPEPRAGGRGRGPERGLQGFRDITEDPEYLAEWSASVAPRDPAPAIHRIEVRPTRTPQADAMPEGPSPAALVVLRHAAAGADDPSAFLASLRRGEAVTEAASASCSRPSTPWRSSTATPGRSTAGSPTPCTGWRSRGRSSTPTPGRARSTPRRSTCSGSSRRRSTASSPARTSATIPPPPDRSDPLGLARDPGRRHPRRRPVRHGHRPARRPSRSSARPSPAGPPRGTPSTPRAGRPRSITAGSPAGPAWRSTSGGSTGSSTTRPPT